MWVSPDFREWTQGWAEAFTLPEPADPSKRGYEFNYDQVHLGVGAANFGNVQVGAVWAVAHGGGRATRAHGEGYDLRPLRWW